MSQGDAGGASSDPAGAEPALCVVTSVGTSLLTNRARDLAERRRLRELAHVEEGELSTGDGALLDRLVAEAEAGLLAGGSAGWPGEGCCAEISGLRDLLATRAGVTPIALQAVILVATDTSLGRRVSRVLSHALERLGLIVEAWTPTGFSARTQAAFAGGLRELARLCAENLPARRARSQRVVFNLCGGFKGLVGSLSMLAPAYADEVVFRFEGPRAELLRIPCAPLPSAAGMARPGADRP